MTKERYFIGSDGSCNSYLVPLDKIKEWQEWANLDADDERSWDEPDYAERLEGKLLTFTDPRIDP